MLPKMSSYVLFYLVYVDVSVTLASIFVDFSSNQNTRQNIRFTA